MATNLCPRCEEEGRAQYDGFCSAEHRDDYAEWASDRDARL